MDNQCRGNSVSFAQFYGPDPVSRSMTGPPVLWHFPGAALSASVKRFRFELGWQPVREARFVAIWTSNYPVNVIRVVHMDSGPTNIVQMGRIDGVTSNSPRPGAVDITAAYNALVAARTMKFIGYQVWTDGVVPWTLYDVHLELNL